MSTPGSLLVSWTDAQGRTHDVGTLTTVGGAEIQRFTYDPAWLDVGFAIGEGLPLVPGTLTPPGGTETFGVFDDAGPDAWGRLVISRAVPAAERAGSLGLLACVADEPRQGALRFSRERGGDFVSSGLLADVGEVTSLEKDASQLAAGDADRATLHRLLAGSSSQGGARPKIAVRDRDGQLAMAKFPSEMDTYDVETCEAVALSVARTAGLSVPDSRLIRLDEDRAILVTARFDRTERGRLGYQSMRTAAGLAPFESFSYRTAAQTARFLSGTSGVRSVLGAACLAVCLHIIDDHARNLGFLRRRGEWELAPLFDLTPYPFEGEGTPLGDGVPRSLEALVDHDWGLDRREVVALATRVALVSRRAWARAVQDVGLDAEVAEACERFMEDAVDFRTLLDGDEPRFG